MNFIFPVEEVFLLSYSVKAKTKKEAREKLEAYLNSYLERGSQISISSDIERIEAGLESAKIHLDNKAS